MRHEGHKDGVSSMPNVTHFQPVAWWWTRRQIGRDLREHYRVLKGLPPKLLALIRKLDTIEGKYLLRYGLSLNASLNPRPDCDVSPPVWPFTITGMATSDYGYARNKSASTCQTNLGGIQSLSSTLRRSSGGAASAPLAYKSLDIVEWLTA